MAIFFNAQLEPGFGGVSVVKMIKSAKYHNDLQFMEL